MRLHWLPPPHLPAGSPRPYTPPAPRAAIAGAGPVIVEEAPAVAAPAGEINLAVVGLQPRGEALPKFDGRRDAAFSAGPKLNPNGGSGEPVESARVFVPDLMIRGPRTSEPLLMARAAPTSPEALREAARMAPRYATPPPAGVTRVANSPSPRLDGRIVYMMAVQMPNVTSYEGSWLLWYAGRSLDTGAVVNPPVPLRKVDPKYVAAAVDERVEGKVQLTAVIRADGRVAEVAVLKPLDARLDRSAAEAMAQWLFQPATLGGVAAEVDVVVEIPFKLAPRSAR